MMRYTSLAVAAAVLSACTAAEFKSTRPFGHFELVSPDSVSAPILPDGVAVLNDTPACDFKVIGRAFVTSYQVGITSSRLDALKSQAAIYGADAIIIHPNVYTCETGKKAPICAGRGEYLIASAIKYIDPVAPTNNNPGLEHSFQSRYDDGELNHSQPY